MSHAPHIVILTGAGISAESGIRTFRDAGGLWEDYPIEQVATPEGFAADPALVHRFYNARRRQLGTVDANPAHFALARLEQALSDKGGALTIVTQNVDNLHERGGSDAVIHMHGELASAWCRACDTRRPFEENMTLETVCPDCGAVGATRPDIVWFGEMPYHMDRIEGLLAGCDLFVSIGTSGAVYPAAGFVQTARSYRKQTLELNLEPSEGSGFFHETRLGPASEIVPAWVDEVIGTL